MKFWTVLVLLLVNAAISTYAQDEQVQEEEVVSFEPIITAHPDVVTSVVFPQSSSKEFFIGTPVRAVLGFANNADEDLNITFVAASLRHPADFRYTVQNFTKGHFNTIVRAGEQASFLYVFLPDPLLEPRDFGLSLSVNYKTDSANYTSTFYNGTIILVEPAGEFDVQTLFTYVGLIGVAGLLGFFVLKGLRSAGKKGKSRRVETGTTKQTEVDNEWLEGTFASVGKSPKSRKNLKKSS